MIFYHHGNMRNIITITLLILMAMRNMGKQEAYLPEQIQKYRDGDLIRIIII